MMKYPVNAEAGLCMGEAATEQEAIAIANAYEYARKCKAMYQNGYTLDAVGAKFGMPSYCAYKCWTIEWSGRKM